MIEPIVSSGIASAGCASGVADARDAGSVEGATGATGVTDAVSAGDVVGAVDAVGAVGESETSSMMRVGEVRGVLCAVECVRCDQCV